MMTDTPVRRALATCLSGTTPANVALMHAIIAAHSQAEIERELGAFDRETGSDERRAHIERLLADNPQAFTLVKTIIDAVQHDAAVADPDETARTFDAVAARSPDASSALYCLGSPRLLAAATAEVVGAVRRWCRLDASALLLDIGCGSGRFAAAFSPYVRQVVGLDVSEKMIFAAAQACQGLGNVQLHRTSGRDLGTVRTATVDVVFAADVFPYLVQSGTAHTQMGETARVLRPGGHLVILNYAYGHALDDEQALVASSFASVGLHLARASANDFSLWDARVFIARQS